MKNKKVIELMKGLNKIELEVVKMTMKTLIEIKK